jgi:hypothetical protein
VTSVEKRKLISDVTKYKQISDVMKHKQISARYVSILVCKNRQRACKLKPPAKFSYEATRFFIAEKLLSFFLFTAIRRSSTQLKISLNPNLLSIQALCGYNVGKFEDFKTHFRIKLLKFHEAPNTVAQLCGLPHGILHVFFPSYLL